MNMLRNGDIAERVQRWKQIKSLEHEADLMPPQPGALSITHCGEIVSIHEHPSLGRLRQASDHVKESRFTTSGGPHHRDKFAWQNVKVYSAQRRNLNLARSIRLPEIFGP